MLIPLSPAIMLNKCRLSLASSTVWGEEAESVGGAGALVAK